MDTNTAEQTPYTPKSQREVDFARLLGSRYRFIRYLGNGAQSTVFAVLNKPLERVEALKLLSNNLTQQKDFLDRFKAEVKISASLTHPNIVTIYEYKKVKNFYFFTMHYIDGPLLTKFIDASTPMPIHSICSNIATVCKAIDYAHNQGVIHRDLKASNIMLDKSGKPYITDFGIAKWEKTLTRTQAGTIMGSPHYVSPEQAAGREIDARSDIYSLGVTLYVLLTQKYPFRGDTPHLTIARRLTYPPIPPETIKPDLPRRLIEILNKALQNNRRDRYQSAADMADDLTDFINSEERAADGRDTAARPKNASGDPTPTQKWLIAAIACIVLIFAAPILLFLNRSNSDSSIERHSVPVKEQARSDAKKEILSKNDESMEQPGEEKYSQELNLFITTVEQHYLDGNFEACIDAASATKSILNQLPVNHQARYAGLKERAESYQLRAIKAIQRQKRPKQNAEADAPLIDKPPGLPPRPSGQKTKTSSASKGPEYLKPKVHDSKPIRKNQKQYLDKRVAKISRQFSDSEFEACLRSVKSTIAIIESYDKTQQKQFAGIKARVIGYREKVAHAKYIQNQKRTITEAIKRKVAKGEYESAIVMVDAMLMKTNLPPEVKEALHNHRKSLAMLVKNEPS